MMKNSKLLNIIKQLIYPTCLFYTVFTVVFYSAGTLFDSADTTMIPKLKTIFLILLFSFILNLANNLLRIKKLSLALRITLHFILTGVSFFFIFIMMSSYKAGTSITIILILCYTLLYFAICGIYFLITGMKKASANEASEYKSIYKKSV